MGRRIYTPAGKRKRRRRKRRKRKKRRKRNVRKGKIYSQGS